jgi:hypothetical protein
MPVVRRMQRVSRHVRREISAALIAGNSNKVIAAHHRFREPVSKRSRDCLSRGERVCASPVGHK